MSRLRLGAYGLSMLAGALSLIAVALVLERGDVGRRTHEAGVAAAAVNTHRDLSTYRGPNAHPALDGHRGLDRHRGLAIHHGPSRSDVALITGRVERLRGLRFRRPVRTRFVARREAVATMRTLRRHRYTASRRRISEQRLKLVGLLAPGESLSRALRSVEEEQVLGFYDDESERLVVVQEEPNSHALFEVTLAHELVHALEDQYFGFHPHSHLDEDEMLGEDALVEGTAAALMMEYAKRYLDLDDVLSALEALPSSQTNLPEYVEASLLFPYLEGEKFVAAFKAGGGWRAVDRVFGGRRPRTSEQVFHLEQYAIDDRPVRVRAPSIAARLGRDWRRVDTAVVGEFHLRTLFKVVGRVRNAAAAAAGWGGGRFELWRRTGGRCPAPCTGRLVGVFALAWDSTRDRLQAERAFRHVFERGLSGRRLASRSGAQLWSSRGGAIGMAGRGHRMAAVLAPTRSLAAELALQGS